MKKLLILFIATVFCSQIFAQQDPQYNLYQFNQMVINPAYAGARDAVAVVLDMRKQWVSFPGAPTTLGFSVHSPILNDKVGVGLSVVADQIGAKSMTAAYGNFAYIAKLNNKCKLSFGLRAGYLNYKFNFSKVNYKDANETALTDLSNTNRGALDIDAGLFLRTNSFFAGISATHLTRAKIYSQSYESINPTTGSLSGYSSSYTLNPHLFFVIGKAFSFSENLVFSPSVMVRAVSKTTMTDFNLNFFIYKRVWLGVFVKGNYGAGALFQVYATDKLRIGYSFDSGLGTKRLLGPSHEIMLGFDFGNYKAKTLSPRFL